MRHPNVSTAMIKLASVDVAEFSFRALRECSLEIQSGMGRPAREQANTPAGFQHASAFNNAARPVSMLASTSRIVARTDMLCSRTRSIMIETAAYYPAQDEVMRKSKSLHGKADRNVLSSPRDSGQLTLPLDVGMTEGQAGDC